MLVLRYCTVQLQLGSGVQLARNQSKKSSCLVSLVVNLVVTCKTNEKSVNNIQDIDDDALYLHASPSGLYLCNIKAFISCHKYSHIIIRRCGAITQSFIANVL